MTSPLNTSGLVSRAVVVPGNDQTPNAVKVDMPGNGVEIVSGWRLGYRLTLGFKNGSEETIDRELLNGERFPCRFDYLKVQCDKSDAQLAVADIDRPSVVLDIWKDTRVIRERNLSQALSTCVQIIRGSPQNIAGGASFTVWDDAVNLVGTSGLDALAQRFQQGGMQGRLLSINGWVSSVTPAPWAGTFSVDLFGYTSLVDAPAVNEPLLYESMTNATAVTIGATTYVYWNPQRAGAVPGQFGVRWPTNGGKMQIRNRDAVNAANFYYVFSLQTP